MVALAVWPAAELCNHHGNSRLSASFVAAPNSRQPCWLMRNRQVLGSIFATLPIPKMRESAWRLTAPSSQPARHGRPRVEPRCQPSHPRGMPSATPKRDMLALPSSDSLSDCLTKTIPQCSMSLGVVHVVQVQHCNTVVDSELRTPSHQPFPCQLFPCRGFFGAPAAFPVASA